ncbi:MAG TPA: helix-turn-helix domain-containing protein [Acidimicrobiales bacterium]|nr:helix-turn-helix domain-containing protein [Acidimicrobiales bacterium]
MATASSQTAGTPASDRELRTQGRRTMAKLLDAGLDVLTERGYHAARVDDVVRVAKLSHGTFYLYFANKEDLFRALARECAEEMEALAESLGPVTPDKAGEAELRAWLTQFVATYRRYGAVIRGWMEEQVVDRELVRRGVHAFQQIIESLQRRLAEADTAHLPDPALATAAMLAMIERLAYFTSSRDLDFSDETVVDVLTTMLHRGVFGAPVNRRRAAASKRS